MEIQSYAVVTTHTIGAIGGDFAVSCWSWPALTFL
jgi:hypothetical protein